MYDLTSLRRIVAASIAKTLKKFNQEELFRAMDGKDEFFIRQLQTALLRIFRTMMSVASRLSISVTLVRDHEPARYYLSRMQDGSLECESDGYDRSFYSVTAKNAATTPAGSVFRVGVFDILRSIDDAELRDFLLAMKFDDEAVCAIIASLIEKQPHGEKGVLATGPDGYNVFETETHCYCVAHSADTWCVMQYPGFARSKGVESVRLWMEGLRIFYPLS